MPSLLQTSLSERVPAPPKSDFLSEGNLRLIEQLVPGSWDPDEFLVVKPDQVMRGVYDWDEVLRAGDA